MFMGEFTDSLVESLVCLLSIVPQGPGKYPYYWLFLQMVRGSCIMPTLHDALLWQNSGWGDLVYRAAFMHHAEFHILLSFMHTRSDVWKIALGWHDA